MRTWGNSYAEAIVEGGTLPYIDGKNLGVYDSSFHTDDTIDNGASGTAIVPASLKLVLDYRPIRTTLSITINAVPASLLEWGITPTSSGQVSVNFTTGEMEFYSGDVGLAIVALYKHYGSVVDAHAFNRMQARIATAPASENSVLTGETSMEDAYLSGQLSMGNFPVVLTEGEDPNTLSPTVFTGEGFYTPGAITAGTFYGNGLGITNIQDGALSSNVPLKNAANTFTGAITATSFSGSGSGLTSLNASNLASGTIPAARVDLDGILNNNQESPRIARNVSGAGYSWSWCYGDGGATDAITIDPRGDAGGQIKQVRPPTGSSYFIRDRSGNFGVLDGGGLQAATGAFTDVITVSKSNAGHWTGLLVQNTNGIHRGEIAVKGTGGGGFTFWEGYNSGTLKWFFGGSTDLSYYSYTAGVGNVFVLRGSANFGAEFYAGGSGSHQFKHGGVDRLKIDSVGIGFYGATPIAKQQIVEPSLDPAVTELQDILIAYGLLIDGR